jgi:hypothetical protein
MAEEKPKGDPVFLTIAGEKITLPGVTSLNTDDELAAAAQDWIGKNYKGPEIGAPVVFRTPLMAAEGGFAPGEEITVRALPTRPFEGSVLGTAAEAAGNLIGVPGFDPETMQLLAPDQGFISQFNRAALEAAQPFVQKLELAAAAPTAALAGLSQLAYNLGLGTQNPRRTAAEIEEAINVGTLPLGTLTGPRVPTARQLLRETTLPPQMQAITEPVTPTPVVPTTLRRPQAVELPEAPALTAEVPVPAVAPTPVRAEPQAVLQQAAASIETPPTVTPERAGNLNLTKFDKPADVKTFLDDVAKANNNFVEARRGVMPIAEINKKAEEVDLQSILGRKVGMALNAEQLQAARSVLNQTADDVFTKVKDWSASGADPTKADEALDLIATHMAFQENLAGATAEAGRALRILREQPSSGRSLALRQLMEERAKGIPAETILERISTLDTPEQVAAFVGKISKPNFRDKFEEYYINALLSGPQTQSINIASNALTAVSAPVEKAIEAGIGAVLRTPDRVTFKEVGARLAGMGQGAVDGLRLAKQAFMTGEAPSAVTALETRRNAISGLKGEIVRLPSRFLMTQDEFFKAIHTRGELAAQAYKKALDLSQGNKEKLGELYNEFLNNPTEAMTKAAQREADYRTFQAELGRPGKFVQRATNEFFLARYILPFVKTPFNLIKYAAERSPLPFISDRWRAEIKAGGRQRNEALAKLTLGGSIAGTIATKALEGMVTGSGPTDPEERSALMATGWQPYSFKIGDTYYPYGRLDPFGTTIGVVADLVTMKDYMTDEEYEKAAALIPFSVATNLAEKTYLQGATNLFEALFSRDTTPQRIEQYFRNAAASLAPNVLRQTANAVDPQLREANSLIQEVQNRVPVIRGNGFSIAGTDYSFDAVPERLDVWGDPVTRTGFSETGANLPASERAFGIVRNLVTPVKSSKTTTDPVKKEVARLQLGLERPDKKVSLAVDIGREDPVKFEIELTDRERRQFTFASGVLGKALVEQDIKSPEWKKLTDDERREKIKDRLSFARKTFRSTIGTRALERYMAENDDLPKIKP